MWRKLINWIAIFLLGISVSLAQEAPPTVFEINLLDIDNHVFNGSELTIDEKGQCLISSDQQKKSVNWQSVVSLSFPSVKPSAGGPYEITLTNRDVIYGDIKESKDNTLVIESLVLGAVTIKFDHLLMIRLKNHTRVSETETENAEDIVYLLSGDKDKGIMTAIQKDTLTLKSSIYDKDRQYNFKDVWLVRFAQIAELPAGSEDVSAVVICQDGTRLTGQIRKAVQRRLFLKSVYGPDYQIPFDQLGHLYFKNTSCIYLSDLKPAAVKEYPSISVSSTLITTSKSGKSVPFLWPMRRDKSVYWGQTISLKGKKYYKGLGVHANCDLTYNLNSGYRKFFAAVGLDDEAGPGGSVSFFIYLDGKKRYDSGLIRWGDQPKEVNLDVSNIKEMKLVVTDGGDYYILDRAAWAGARLIKE
ncbi:MAG: NPCBM/NEW2 domain-containing protein [Planctomycetes bacterium]|nr:NPCBM/NEW2 domain-containing protein [Planctomycetota bacterium]